MNAARPVFQPSSSNDSPPLSLNVNAPAAPASAPDAKSQDFAGALTQANAKPDCKSGSHKANSSSASGSPLPAAGNPPPPPPPAAAPPPAGTPNPAPAKIAVTSVVLKAVSEKIASGSVSGNASNAQIMATQGVAQAEIAAAAAGNAAATAPAITAERPLDASGSATAQTPAALSAQLPAVAAPGNTGSIGPVLVPTADPVPTATSGATEADPVFATTTFAAAAQLAPSPAASTAPSPAPVDAVSTRPARAAEPIATMARNMGELQQNSPAPNNPAAQLDGNTPGGVSALSDTALPANTVSPTSAPPADAGAAALQSIMASIVQGGADKASSPTATADDLPTPATASDAPATAVVAALASRPAAASAAAAARMASNAQVVAVLSGAAAIDKLAHAAAAPIDVTSGAAQSSAGTGASTDMTPAPTLNVAAGVGSAEFGQGVADRVSLMVDSNLSSAKLQVNPPALGPIEVKIALQAGHAQVWLTSHSALTRDALESSSPKLREMLGAQGFSQVSVDISQRSFQDRTPPSKGYEAMPSIDAGAAPALAEAAAVSRAASGLLDAYA